jgi:hypothetical protein
MAGSCEQSKEPSGFIRRGEFLEWLRNCKFVREAPDLSTESSKDKGKGMFSL